MASILKLSLILLIFLHSFNPCKSSNDKTFNLNVDFPSFIDSFKLATKETYTISNFFQHSNINCDCVKLLDSAQEVLDWSLNKFRDPHGKYVC